MIYLLFFLFLLGLIINSLSKKYILSQISYFRELSKKTLEIGEEFFITTIVENKKILPVTFLQIVEQLPSIVEYKFKTEKFITKDFLYHTMTFFLLPFQRIKRRYVATCKSRGRYIFGEISLFGGDFIGVNVSTKTFNFNQDIVVLPKKINVEKSLIPHGNYNGDMSVRRWIIEDPTMIIGIKDYTGQEPAKTIHWPSSLKYGKLMVKNFDFTYENTAMIILNVECTRPYWLKIDEEAIESCISITRGVGEIFEERKIPFGFVTNALIYGLLLGENVIHPSSGEYHLNTFLEYLGRTSYNVSIPLENILREFSGKNFLISTYVIITPRVLKEYVPYINSFYNDLNRVILISFKSDDLDLISDRIMKYTIRKEKDGALIS